MRKFFHDNGLSLVLASLFLMFWTLQAWSGWQVHNEDLRMAARPGLVFGDYLQSGHFWQATGENWESEFLQMGFYVVLAIFLHQRGSAESKDPDCPHNDKTKSVVIFQNSISIHISPNEEYIQFKLPRFQRISSGDTSHGPIQDRRARIDCRSEFS